MTEHEIARIARRAFDTEQTVPANWGSIQRLLAAWQVRNFGFQPAVNMTLGVCEEAGELAHAVLKNEQKIRGMADTDAARAAVSDALGDLLVYATQVATIFRLDLGTIYALTASMVMGRDWVADPAKGLQVQQRPAEPEDRKEDGDDDDEEERDEPQ